ncbi:UNVERIFIED_CONTAM: hypothetical protein NCL1_35025 [Trichonephila clavipes]
MQHSEKQSYMQSAFLPSAPSRDPQNRPHVLSRQVYPEQHSKKQSYMQSAFLPSAPSRDPQNWSSACPFETSLSGT